MLCAWLGARTLEVTSRLVDNLSTQWAAPSLAVDDQLSALSVFTKASPVNRAFTQRAPQLLQIDPHGAPNPTPEFPVYFCPIE